MEEIEPRPGVVYVVTDALEPDRVRYVGRTIQGLEKRVTYHWGQLKYGRRAAFQNWLAKRDDRRADVRFTVVSEHPNLQETDEAEKKAIAYYRGLGMADLNIKDGGQGGTGGPWSAERRERQMKTIPRGETHVFSKLTWEAVNGIRALRQREWVSSRELAEEYCVSLAQVTAVLRNEEWHDPDFDPKSVVKIVRSGEGAYHRMFTWDDIRLLRQKATGGYVSPYHLADEFGTSQPNVRDILENRIWVDPAYDPAKVVKRPLGYRPEKPAKKPTRLTKDQVIEMRHKFKSGHTLKQLSHEYGVIPNSVSRIVTGATWGHVKEGLE